MPRREENMEAPDMSSILFPLAGVMILLLATIIGNAQSLFANTSIQVDLPKANVIETDLEQVIPVSIDRQGNYYFKDEKVPDLKTITEKVRQAQKQYAEENGDPELEGYQMVVVRGDRNITWGTVLAVVDAVKKAKSKRVVLAVNKRRGA